MQKNLETKSKISQIVRKELEKKDFIDIETEYEEDDFSSDEIGFADDDHVGQEMLMPPPPKIKPDALFSDEEFFDRSIDFLVSLGYKKKEARSVIDRRSRVFSDTPINEDNFEDFAKFLLFER